MKTKEEKELVKIKAINKELTKDEITLGFIKREEFAKGFQEGTRSAKQDEIKFLEKLWDMHIVTNGSELEFELLGKKITIAKDKINKRLKELEGK